MHGKLSFAALYMNTSMIWRSDYPIEPVPFDGRVVGFAK